MSITMNLTAHWIWKKQARKNPYNQTILARRIVESPAPARVVIAVTADSYYRLLINGRWVADGPGRSWPEHHRYDELDVSAYWTEGRNEITILARYLGVGSAHRVPRRPGLLAQLELTAPDGKKTTIASDQTWQVAEARAWRANTFRRWEPGELYDARLESPLRFSRAEVICPAAGGPWGDLQPRDVALLDRKPVALRRFMGAQVVRRDWLAFHFPVARLLYPELIEQNTQTSVACVVATVIECPRAGKIRLQTHDFKLTVNGRPGEAGTFRLKAGRNLLLALAIPYFGYHVKGKSLRFLDTRGFRRETPLTLENPLAPGHENPWCFVPLEEGRFTRDDLIFITAPSPEREAFCAKIDGVLAEIEREVTDPDSFRIRFGAQAKVIPSSEMLSEDPTRPFFNREPLGDALAHVQNPAALMADNAEWTEVFPSPRGDVELAYDLGEQHCGYYEFELMAEAGLIVDVNGIEYIMPDGRLQLTCHASLEVPFPNGMRYVCKEGANRFISLARRSGRHLFLTLRGQTRPARVRRLGLIESLYPAAAVGSFSCSDARLDKIWEISARTVRLCMEDTLVDCPLYEQTFWVGDARNEALYAFTAFGAADLVRHGLRLGAESLERYPLVGCQMPSSWDVILPAWSFLWGLALWEYYEYTADEAFLKQTWPDALRNLRGAEKYVNQRGLFSAPFWNMFDWADQDILHDTVTHNSLFMIGAIDAALRTARLLGDRPASAWLRRLRRRLARGVNQLWDAKKKAYPDSIHNDGAVSERTSQHTSFLAILYDVIEPKNMAAARRNLTDPPEAMVRVGSPFAIQFLYETYEKLGLPERILDSIRENYVPMLEAGATTVWEIFPSGHLIVGDYPTRSHAHGWSAAPLYYLNRLILGLRPAAPGGRRWILSPWVARHEWAKGASATPHGAVEVSWKKNGARLEIETSAPAGVRLAFKPNPSHQGLKVFLNGKEIRRAGASRAS